MPNADEIRAKMTNLLARARPFAERSPSTSDACFTPPEVGLPHTQVGSWTVMASVHHHANGVEHWHLAARLRTAGSTEEDRALLGEIVYAAQEASTPEGFAIGDGFGALSDLATTPPNAVHHWAWHGDGSPLDPEALAKFKAKLPRV